MERCKGHGQGVCKTCKELGLGTGAWGWMTMLYKVNGYDGIYCYEHAKELEEKQNMNNMNNTNRILNCKQCGKPLKQDEANVYFYHVKGSKGIKHNKCRMVCSDCYDKLREDTVMDKQYLIDTIVKTKEYLVKLENMLENMEFERWKPKNGDRYFFIDSDGDVADCVFDAMNTYKRGRCDSYNCFQTFEQAKAEAENILVTRMLQDIATRLNQKEKMDWSNDNQPKYCLCYDYSNNELYNKGVNRLSQINTYTTQLQGVVYCLSSKFAHVAIQEIGQERLEDYLKG